VKWQLLSAVHQPPASRASVDLGDDADDRDTRWTRAAAPTFVRSRCGVDVETLAEVDRSFAAVLPVAAGPRHGEQCRAGHGDPAARLVVAMVATRFLRPGRVVAQGTRRHQAMGDGVGGYGGPVRVAA
jgi:hypothetical protein